MGTHTEMREKPISESTARRMSQCMELKPTSFSGSIISPPHSLLGGEMKGPGNKDELKQREGVLQKMMGCCQVPQSWKLEFSAGIRFPSLTQQYTVQLVSTNCALFVMNDLCRRCA